MGFDRNHSSHKKPGLVQAKLPSPKDRHPAGSCSSGSMKGQSIFCFVAAPCTLCALLLCVFILSLSLNTCRLLYDSQEGFSAGLVKMIRENVLSKQTGEAEHVTDPSKDQACKGKYVFMYDVPAQFNEDLAHECTIAGRGPCAEPWGCLYCGGLENEGIGVQVPSYTQAENSTRISQNGYNYNYSVKLEPAEAWYRTHQFSLEVIFHAKMKRYVCLTTDVDRADAFYVPYYAGQDAAVSMKCNALQVRDKRVNRFLGWLTGQETWQKMRGQRHFMVLGRQPLDMNRTITANRWGLPITTQPELANVTFLWWEKAFHPTLREMGIPYPTSFHPSSDAHLKIWQEKVKEAKREWLVSYVGSAKRRFRHESTLKFRQELKRQCDQEQSKCRFMDCTLQYTRWQIPCESEPEIVMLEFSNSVFCLQPEGDTPTRKGFFDGMLAGCIPVVFSNVTAHLQYEAFLPSDPSLYSIFLNKDNIAVGTTNFVHELANISKEKIQQLQNTIREDIIPRIIFSSPSSSITFNDALNISLQQLFSNFNLSLDRY